MTHTQSKAKQLIEQVCEARKWEPHVDPSGIPISAWEPWPRSVTDKLAPLLKQTHATFQPINMKDGHWYYSFTSPADRAAFIKGVQGIRTPNFASLLFRSGPRDTVGIAM